MSRMSPNEIGDALSDADYLEAEYVRTGRYTDWALAALAWYRYDRAWKQYDWERRHGGPVYS